MRISEITHVGRDMPNNTLTDTEESEYFYHQFVDGSTQITEITTDVWLHEKGDVYSLVKNNQIYGFIKTTPDQIQGKNYTQIQLIYVLKQFRNTPVVKWIMYGISELGRKPLIIDGAIFNGGSRIIDFMDKNNLFKLELINRVTGEITPFKPNVSDIDQVIRVRTAGIGFKDNKIVESQYYWIPIEDFLGKI